MRCCCCCIPMMLEYGDLSICAAAICTSDTYSVGKEVLSVESTLQATNLTLDRPLLGLHTVCLSSLTLHSESHDSTNENCASVNDVLSYLQSDDLRENCQQQGFVIPDKLVLLPFCCLQCVVETPYDRGRPD